MSEATVVDVEQDEVLALFGNRDENLRVFRDLLGLKIVLRNGNIVLQGNAEQLELGLKVLDQMRSQYRRKQILSPEDVRVYISNSPGVRLTNSTSNGGIETASTTGIPSLTGSIEIAGPVKRLRARSSGQIDYIEAIRQHDLTFSIGPAGTGKTYLAVAAALEAFRSRTIKRLVLVRPAVEAGEKLGFLPGDLQAKVHPFVQPLLDALREMLDYQQVRHYMETEVIEIAPLAFMRGRTLNEAFIILDEGQNTTIPQMRMFLTRMGMGSKVVVTGDVTQVDLPRGVPNGLDDAVRRLGHLPRVATVRMKTSDIVRHPLVQAIVDAYESSPNSDAPTD